MRHPTIFLTISFLLLGAFATETEAKSKSSNIIRVSCAVPPRLELSMPTAEKEKTEEKIVIPIKESPSSMIQTQQVYYRGKQKIIIYTVTER